MQIGIIGYGIVGKAIDYTISKYHSTIKYDKYNQNLNNFSELRQCEFIFIAVPTPFDCKNNISDDSAVRESLGLLKEMNYQNIIIIKSTVSPGQCDKYLEEYGLNIVFNPEFLRESTTPNEDFENQNTIVIGCTNDKIYQKTDKLFKSFVREDANYYNVTPREAEMIKCCQNTMLASRVATSNMIFDICRNMNVDYNLIRNIAFIPFDIIGPHMSQVPGPDGNRGFGGKCLPKDSRALNSVSPHPLLNEIIKYNDTLRDDLDKFMHNWK